MAFDSIAQISIQDINGNYYTAQKNQDGNGWAVTTVPTQTFVKTLPKGWDEASIIWERHPDFLGVFRSSSGEQNFLFSDDARAIIQYIYKTQGIQGYGLITIWQFNPAGTGYTYDIFYPSNLDFKTYNDNIQDRELSIGTLDSGLITDVQAYENTRFNIAAWRDLGGGAWELNDAIAVQHNGIKLLYSASFESSASADLPLSYLSSPLDNRLYGWNQGARGDGYHIIPPMAQYNLVQNNGATTYIGNTILQPFIIQGNQTPGAANFGSESLFSGVNHTQPYTRNNFSIKNLLPGTGTFDANFTMEVDFSTSLGTYHTVESNIPGPNPYIAFVLFEIDETDSTAIVASRYTIHATLLKKSLNPSTGGFAYTDLGYYSTANDPVRVTLSYNKVYVLGIIADNDAGIGGDGNVGFQLRQLNYSLVSVYDYGFSGSPIPAPLFPTSYYPAFRLSTLLEKVVPYLATRNTDSNGFPVPVITAYTGESDLLSDTSLVIGDVCPYQIAITSEYCLHDLQGQSFVSISLADIFDFCKKQLGCGAGIEYDVDGNPTIFRIEDLRYFFDITTTILDLGTDIYDLQISALAENLGANLKLGYTKVDVNSNFGVDSFNTELFFNTPLSNIPSVMDYEESNILTDQYGIELKRAQQVSQPIGSTFDPANPSGENQSIAVYIGTDGSILCKLYNPGNYEQDTIGFAVMQYNNAQSNDSTAASAPYVNGLYYPDTAINLPLSPCRALLRGTGAYLHSVLDNMDTEHLTFRNTSVMQYNNVFLNLSGISSNLQVGAGATPITEYSDKLIGDLPPQLFKPIIFRFKSKYPVNMFQIIKTNPRGKISFTVMNQGFGSKTYTGFIKRVEQVVNQSATQFELYATHDTEL